MPELAAHALHLAPVILGLAGLAVLLLPQVLPSPPGTGGRRGGFRPPADAAEHAARVAALRLAVHEGRLGVPALTAPARRADAEWRTAAVVAGIAAAGVHAAMAPPHLRESAAAGLFFVLVALVQGGWSCRLVAGCSSRDLRAGIVLNLGVIAVWALSRGPGLPWGLGRERVGAWDLAALGWELCVVVACAAGLRGDRTGSGPLHAVSGRLWAYAGLSAAALLALTLSAGH